MADTQLPKFDDKKVYVVTGRILNQIVAQITANKVLSADGLDIERTPDGIRIKTRQQ